MKIGITCHTGSGGSGILATELGLQMARRGHEVHFITREIPFRLPGFVDNVFMHPVDSVYYPLFQEPPHTLSLASKMAEVAESYGLDVLHVHYAIPHTVSAYIARQMLAPRPIGIVTTLHGTDITLVGNQPIFQRITRFCIDVSDRVTAVSDFLRDATHTTFGVEREVRTIHNFVDTERFRPRSAPQLRRRFAPANESIVMHASNFRPVKNIGLLLQVFAGIHAAVPARLVLIGEGPDITLAKQQTYELGLEGRVVFLGNQEAIEELLPLADLFLLPSLHESFGLAALEAMACGVPVITTNVGGPGEFILEGENGYLRSPEDAASWVAIAVELLRDPAARARLSAAGRRVATDRFDRDSAVVAYEEEYVSALRIARTR